MKRGFEENVPKVRPRVRLGRSLAEIEAEESAPAVPASVQKAHAERAHAENPKSVAPPPRAESVAMPTIDTATIDSNHSLNSALHIEREAAPSAGARDSQVFHAAPSRPPMSRLEQQDSAVQAALAREQEERARGDRLREVRARAEAAAAPMEAPAPIENPEESAGPRSAARKIAAAQKVAQAARELAAELELAAEANSRLKSDLDGALAALRRAAEEVRERTEERDRFAAEVEKRAAAAGELLGELELLEAERDGAMAQTARFSRELRESRSTQGELQEVADQARAQMDEARGQLQRLAGELEARVAERDAARAELARVRSEKDSLAEALLAARAEADEAMESRTALEEIERALGAARSRVQGIR